MRRTKGEGGGEEDVAMEQSRMGIGSEDVGALLGLFLLLVYSPAGGSVVVRVLGDVGDGVGEEVGRVILDEISLLVVVVVELSLGLKVEVGGGSRMMRGSGEDDEVRGREELSELGDSCVCEYRSRVSEIWLRAYKSVSESLPISLRTLG